MRYSKEHKEQTRERILQAAGRVFKKKGYTGGGIDAVMREAGLTHGGFYAHFRNKKALFAETLEHNAQRSRQSHHERNRGLEGEDWIQAMSHFYLSPEHREHVAEGCPMPPLLSEIGRVEPEAQKTFEEVLVNWRDDLAEHMPQESPEERSAAALSLLVSMIGGLTLSRAVHSEALADALLAAGREQVDRLLESRRTEDPTPRRENP